MGSFPGVAGEIAVRRYLQLFRQRQGDRAGGGPLGAAHERGDEAGQLHGIGIVPEGGGEDAAIAELRDPEHGLIQPGTGNGLFLAGLVQRVVVVGGGEHVIRAFRLPLQIRVQLVIGLREGSAHAAGDGMVRVGDGDGEIVTRRVMAVVGPPVAGAHLFELAPAVEGRGGEVVHHQALAAAHEVQERVVGARRPSEGRACCHRSS